MKLIHHSEIEYDFELTYHDRCPYDTGAEVISPAMHDNGCVSFPGHAYVVCIKSEHTSRAREDRSSREFSVYVKQYPLIT